MPWPSIQSPSINTITTNQTAVNQQQKAVDDTKKKKLKSNKIKPNKQRQNKPHRGQLGHFKRRLSIVDTLTIDTITTNQTNCVNQQPHNKRPLMIPFPPPSRQKTKIQPKSKRKIKQTNKRNVRNGIRNVDGSSRFDHIGRPTKKSRHWNSSFKSFSDVPHLVLLLFFFFLFFLTFFFSLSL